MIYYGNILLIRNPFLMHPKHNEHIKDVNKKISLYHFLLANRIFDKKKDIPLSIFHYEIAAAIGDVRSQNNLATIYQSGEHTTKSLFNAEKYYKLAADLGYPPAQLNLAKLYISSYTSNYSKKQALIYTKLASEQDYIPAIKFLGTIYQYGDIGVKSSLDKSSELYMRAYKLGDMDSANSAAIIYSTQMSPRRNRDALRLFRIAAISGNIDAMYNLATMIQKGEGCLIDQKAAFGLYLASALKGHRDSIYNVAIMYKEGLGVEQSMDQCRYWLLRGVDLGDVGSIYAIKLINSTSQGKETKHANLAKSEKNEKTTLLSIEDYLQK